LPGLPASAALRGDFSGCAVPALVWRADFRVGGHPAVILPLQEGAYRSTGASQLMKPDRGGSVSQAHRTQMAKNDGMAARGCGTRGSGPASAGAHAEQTRHRRSIYPSRGDALLRQGEAEPGEVVRRQRVRTRSRRGTGAPFIRVAGTPFCGRGKRSPGKWSGVSGCVRPAGVAREPSGGGLPREIRRTTLCALLRLRAGL
jgi:hypothetical protein